MTTRMRCPTIALIGISLVVPIPAAAQLMSTCTSMPPAGHATFRCTVLETKLLPERLRPPVFWHIDRFDTGGRSSPAPLDAMFSPSSSTTRHNPQRRG